MICKNCGAQLPDNSVFCGNCGAAQEKQPPQPVGFGGNMPNPNPPMGDSGFQPAPNPTFNPNPNPNGGFDPNAGFNPNVPAAPNAGGIKGLVQNKKNIAMIAIPVVALILVAAIVAGVVSVVGSNPDKTIDRFMTAFMDHDGEAMSGEVSESYKKAIVYAMETIDYINDGAISDELDEDMDEFIDELLVETLEDESNSFFRSFERSLGSNYKTEYEITAEEKADKDELEKFNEVVSRISGKDFKANGLMLADIKVNGKSGSEKYEDEFTLFLCKDGSKWKVLEMYDVGYDFDDLYSGLNLSDIESYFR